MQAVEAGAGIEDVGAADEQVGGARRGADEPRLVAGVAAASCAI